VRSGKHFIARRAGLYGLNFVIPRLMPGNAATALMARSQGQLPASAMKAMEIAFGINTKASLLTQYFEYIRNTFTGHWGISFTYFPVPVVQVIGTMLPWTILLIGMATIIAFFLGTLIGVYSAWRRGNRLADGLPVAFTLLSAMPYFWFALALVYVVGFLLNWFPTSHSYGQNVVLGLNFATIASVLYHSFLPACSIVVTSLGGWILSMRNNLIGLLSEDYVVLAQMKGLPESEVMMRYGARNALLPVLTNFAMSLGFVVGGAVVVEEVFSYPGIGFALFSAVSNSDYPLIQGIFLIIVVAVLVANFAVDILYSALDPRVSHA